MSTVSQRIKKLKQLTSTAATYNNELKHEEFIEVMDQITKLSREIARDRRRALEVISSDEEPKGPVIEIPSAAELQRQTSKATSSKGESKATSSDTANLETQFKELDLQNKQAGSTYSFKNLGITSIH